MNEDIQIRPCEAYRAIYIKRWAMVSTTKPQSLAEHTFGVITIALAIAEIKHVLHLRHEIIEQAYIHDMAEVYTGDVPTPTKRIFATTALNRFEKSCSYVGMSHQGSTSQLVNSIVKMADLVEACVFLHNHSDCNYGKSVLREMEKELYDSEDEAALKIYDELLNAEPRSLYRFYRNN